MNFDIQDHDDLEFDRLVDGELSADERRQLIASLDGHTDGWRRCALAFLEAQSWRGAMRQMVNERDTKLPASSVVELPAATKSMPAKTKLAASAPCLAMAAAVLVAFTLGRRMNGPAAIGDAELLATSGPAAGGAAATPAEAPDAARLSDADAITLVVHDANGRPQRVQVPLVEGSRLGEQFGAAPQWAAPQVRSRLAEQGIDLKARRRYAPLYFEQQNGMVPMVVPVDDAVITPVSRTMY